MIDSEYLEIKNREERCVCKQCGSSLQIQLVTYNRYGGQGIELYCPNCSRIEYGTEPEIYQLARQFIDSTEFNYFVDMVEDERNVRLNIAKICEILTWCCREVGILDKDGFKKTFCSFLRDQ